MVLNFLFNFCSRLEKNFIKQCVQFLFTSLDLSGWWWCCFPVEFLFIILFNSLASPLLCPFFFFKESKHMCQPSLICSSILLITIQVNIKVYAMFTIYYPLTAHQFHLSRRIWFHQWVRCNYVLWSWISIRNYIYKQKMYSCPHCIIDSCEFSDSLWANDMWKVTIVNFEYLVHCFVIRFCSEEMLQCIFL